MEINNKKLIEENIYFGYEYCAICSKPLSLNEVDICDDCFFETSKPLNDEEIKIMEMSNDN